MIDKICRVAQIRSLLYAFELLCSNTIDFVRFRTAFLEIFAAFLHFCMTFVLPKDVYFVSEQTIEAV